MVTKELGKCVYMKQELNNAMKTPNGDTLLSELAYKQARQANNEIF